MKRLISCILAIVMVCSMIPATVFSVSGETVKYDTQKTNAVLTNSSVPNEHIYYSDLFYGYSYYLNDNTLFANHIDSQEAMNVAFNEYLNSPQFTWAAISKHISLTTSMSELMKAYSDKLGLTNISYNNNLDEANKIFVQALFELKIEDVESLSQDTKCIDQFKKILETMQKVLKSIYDANEIETYNTFIDLAYADMEEYCTNLKPILPSLKSGTYTAISELLGAMDDTKKALNLFASLIISLGMEDVRLDIIKDIIETQDSESILHEGMSRLYSQLQNGFVDYFLDTYFKNEVINEISKNVSNYITQKTIETIATTTGKLSAQTVTSVLGVVSASIGFINTVIFDWILNIPSIEDYQVTMILAQYSDLMRKSIVKKQSVFQSQFKMEEIEKYETLVDAYAASMRCALDECKSLVSESLAFQISEDVSNELEAQKTLYGDNFYNDYIDEVKKVVKKTEIENRKISNYGTWVLTGDTNICGGSDTIESGNLYCIPQGFPGNILKDYDNNTINIAKDQNVQINGNLTINQYTGTGATIQPNASIKIQGDFFYNKYDGLGYSDTDALIENYGTIKVEGNAKFTGDYSYYFGGRKAANFNNYGNMEVNGNFTMMEFAGTLNNDGSIICNGEFGVYSSGTVNNNGKISLGSLILYSYYEQAPGQYSTLNMSSSAVLEVSGDIYIHDYDNTFGGKLILNGDKQQKIQGLKARNIEVRNPMGIKYLSDVTLYGEYRLNGKPLDNNGFKTYCYADASFADNSDYKELYVAYENTVKLDQSIKGNITVVNEGGLIIPSECDITIDGNVHFGAQTDFANNGKCEITGSLTMSGNNSWMPSCDYIRNNGTLSVRGNLLLETNSEGKAKLINGASSTLRIGGNFDDGSSGGLEGSVIFDGTLQQTVTCSAPTIILKNKSPEGVVFTSSIRPTRLFNHNGNKYTLYNNGAGSSFVDYDGDGLKDNEDPYPTLPDGITSITIPDSVTSIDDYAFYGCTELTSIRVDENNKNYCSVDGVLYNKDKSELVCYPAGKTGEYVIPNSVTGISDDAFYRCAGLTSITIPDSVTNIGNYVFSGCTGLMSITIPNSVTSIGRGTFSSCTGLTSITIPDSVTSMGDYAFSECTRLASITIPNSVTSIGRSSFSGCTSLTSITIPDSVTSIGRSSFSGCKSLTSITIPNSVTSIGRNAFSGCTSLISVTIPDSVTTMDWQAFSSCKIKELIIADDSKIVNSRMLVCKSTLENVTIPDSVTSIGERAFSGCTWLKAITVDENNKNYCSINGVLYNKDKSELVCYPAGKTGEYTISDSVTSIGGSAFYGCTGLTSITIPDSVTSIGGLAFSGCTGLTSITMSDSVTSLGERAFIGCKGLTSITIPDSVTSIGSFAFNGCDNLVIRTTERSAAQKYAVDNNIKYELIPKTALKFSSAYLTLQDDLSLNYKVSKDLIDNGGYSNPYVVFKLGDRTVKVDKYTLSEDGKNYVFIFNNITPDQMNDSISATLYAEFNGVEYTSETKEYSVAQYCYNLLGKYSGDENAKLRTLLVDLLNYGSASQIYTGHNTENLANAKLTEEQKGFATVAEPTLTTVKNTAYKTIENPAVTWKGAGLNLQKSVTMRFKIAADSIDGLSVKVESESGGKWIIPAKSFVKTDGGYYIYFNGLNAGQMSEPVYLTVYNGDTAVSDTLRYSVESYAYTKKGSTDVVLNDLLIAMMKYGNAAYAYTH